MLEGDPIKKSKIEDLVNHAPFPFCDFETEATSYLEEPKLVKLQGDSTSLTYRCKVKGFDAKVDAVTKTEDFECDQPFQSTLLGPRSCKGEPAHSKFFEKSPYDFRMSAVEYL